MRRVRDPSFFGDERMSLLFCIGKVRQFPELLVACFSLSLFEVLPPHAEQRLQQQQQESKNKADRNDDRLQSLLETFSL